jgi:hypothetical protein
LEIAYLIPTGGRAPPRLAPEPVLDVEPLWLEVEETEPPLPLVPFEEGGIGVRHGINSPWLLHVVKPAALTVVGTRTATRATARIVANTFFMTSLLF